MSLGVNLLAALVKRGRAIAWTKASISKFWKCITGPRSTRRRSTAFLLGEAAAEGRNKSPSTSIRRGAETALTGARQSGDIGFCRPLRGGTVTGDHSVDLRRPL